MENNEQEPLSIGYIELAASDCGVKRNVYYSAKKRLEEGKNAISSSDQSNEKI